jgi:hypothetical protein
MAFDFLSVLDSLRPFRHRWLGSAFIAESQRQAWAITTKKQHYVPESYLQRWAVNDLVQPFQVDVRVVHPPRPPREVGRAKNLYTLPEYGATAEQRLRSLLLSMNAIDCLTAVLGDYGPLVGGVRGIVHLVSGQVKGRPMSGFP